MLESLLKSKYIETGIHTLICWPEPAGRMDQNEYEALKKKQVKFFKKAGVISKSEIEHLILASSRLERIPLYWSHRLFRIFDRP